MKKTSFVKKILLVAMMLTASCCLFGGLAMASDPYVRPEVVLGSVSYEEVYKQGHGINLPQTQIRIGNETYDAVTIVVYPDGTAKKQTRAVLSQAGVYEVRYKAVCDGVEFYESRYFTVMADPTAAADETGPEIRLDFAPFTESSVPAEVPLNCKFPVFAATAWDAETGESKVNARVFYDYYNFASRYELDVAKGYFTPDKTGKYTIVYTSEDGFKNSSIKLHTINVTDRTYPMSLAISEGEKQSACGELLEVAPCEYSGGLGKLNLKITAIGEDGREYNCTGGSFRPMEFGDFRIVYTLTDSVGQEKTDEYVVEVLYNTDPVFLTEPRLPKYFIEGGEYLLPAQKAYDTPTGEYVDSVISVSDGNGESEVADNRVSPVPDADGNAKIIYTAEGAYGSKKAEFVIPVIKAFDDMKVHTAKYFGCVNMTATATADNVVLENAQTGVPTSFEFIKELYADEANFVFGIDSAKNNFARINIYFEDYLDASRKVKLSFVRGTEKDELSYLYINDAETTTATASTFFSNVDYDFSYNAARSLIIEAGGIGNAYLTEYLDGRPFEGFPSGRIYFRVELEDVTGPSAIRVKTINGQNFTSGTRDSVAPAIKFMEEYSNSYDYGDTLKLWKCFVTDVLDPRIEATMTVSYRENSMGAWQTVSDVNGNKLASCPIAEYEIKLDRYGDYRVTYTFEDTSNRAVTAYVNFTVFDLEGPTVEMDMADEITVKKGSEIALPAVRVTDNSEGECSYTFFLTNNKGIMTVVDKNFVVAEAGTYKLQLLAKDVLGNLTMKTVVIKVEE